ncbi:MAG: deoxyribose-phosphate aldolase [Syntrophomonadaceae bacterium]
MGVGNSLVDKNLARMIDHTLLKPDATTDEVRKLCQEAREYTFASVCVNPSFVPLCKDMLKGTPVKVCTVIGFPLGATTTEVKRFEAEQALQNGAQEIDMVLNVGMLKQGDNDYVFNDINQVVLAAKKHNAVCKVILETALLTDEEKVRACLICKNAKADFVKTSTGFSKGGATAGDIALMRYVVGTAIGVKASGGIRTLEDAETMIQSGADRIGASASVKIVTGEKSTKDGY